jgi:poly-gamma-glutamate capsule biosynthesis protein CapA/YwtB (metallophosphatase superfamily)
MTRTVSSVAATIAIGLAIAAATPLAPTAQSLSPAASTPQFPTVTEEMSFAATGDSIILRPVSVYEKEPAFSRVMDLVRGATVAFTNFEFSAFDTGKFEPVPQAEFGGLWLHGTRKEAEDLKWMGFDMVSRANNHTTDYGVAGMNETNAILDEIGLVHAGSGQTLGQARRPGYFQTAVGRVAMISVASSFTPSSRAMDARPDIKGRPGLNGLRWSRHLYVESELFDRLKAVAEKDFKISRPADQPPDQFSLFGTLIKKGPTNRVEFVADERDVAAVVAQVRSARRQADLVFVTIHAHEPGNNSEVPADFLPLLARATIDAGADLFTGHGPHRLRGIEVYKGKPIFYSLGNFMYHCYTLEPQGADVYERSPKLTLFESSIADLYDSRPTGFGSNVNEEVWWQSVVAIAKFGPGKLRSIELHPVELGYGTPRPQIGTPRLAHPAVAKKIIDELARLSKPFSTNLQFVNGIGVVDLAKTQTDASR